MAASTILKVSEQCRIINCCSVKTKEPAVAKEVVIALATGVKGVRIIVTDSKNFILRFTKGRVSRHALRVLRGSREDITTKTNLLWTTAHSSLPGNEAALITLPEDS
ncbi:hypothetical protein HPB47_019603 [Ixodes persulcatus]|uniref:Uncharacterized protein n=1 Tax=Ixodes persulcatus TaxID=34615 RepID=A0AC60QHW5_IXOPE|nr:hypothetical protein HPB47_019603 [Ixodes persulcatus]